MALRWYSVVIDCSDVAAQAAWWRQTLGWQTVYDSPDEVVIVPGHLDEATMRATPWEQRGPGLVFVRVDDAKRTKNRLHLDIAPHSADDRDAQIRDLLDRGARLVDVGQQSDVSWTVLADPEGNEFCVLSARDM